MIKVSGNSSIGEFELRRMMTRELQFSMTDTQFDRLWSWLSMNGWPTKANFMAKAREFKDAK